MPEIKEELTNNQKKLKELTKMGLEVTRATFHAAVDNADNMPSSHYNAKSDNIARKAEMWLCPNIFVFKQGMRYFSTSVSNMIFAHFKD